jgi:glycosyltransferase involved in cell wall biosynthesis
MMRPPMDLPPSRCGTMGAEESLQRLAVLIPAYNPPIGLPTLVTKLRRLGFGPIIVVDDGSDEAFAEAFRSLETLPGVDVLRHSANLGKGRALKTGIDHLLRIHPWVNGVITADSDGQHTPADIERVAWALLRKGHAVIGSRGFTGDVPWPSTVGNRVTRHIFRFLTGIPLNDTQTGLRGLPVDLLPELLRVKGERYEFELAMLLHLCRSGLPPSEVPIQTIYIDRNSESHFRPLRDSIRIYSVLLRSYTLRASRTSSVHAPAAGGYYAVAAHPEKTLC